MDKCGNSRYDVCGSYSSSEYYTIRIGKLKHLEYCDYSKRIESFCGNKFSNKFPVSIKDLADAGFFWSKTSDCVICFCCGISIGNWEFKDHPWVEHSRLKGLCFYVQLNQEIVSKYADRYTADAIRCVAKWVTSNISETLMQLYPYSSVKNALFQRYEEEKMMFESFEEGCEKVEVSTTREISNDIQEILKCKYCLKTFYYISVVFLPCGHLLTCSRCALRFDKCPKCQCPIKALVRAKICHK